MLIMHTDIHGNVTIERIPDLPSDFTCPEWKAYMDACCDATGGEEWTADQARTYEAYHAAMQRRYDAQQEGGD